MIYLIEDEQPLKKTDSLYHTLSSILPTIQSVNGEEYDSKESIIVCLRPDFVYWWFTVTPGNKSYKNWSNYKKWSEEEVANLKILVRKRNLSWRDIARLLDRSKGSTAIKAKALGFKKWR